MFPWSDKRRRDGSLSPWREKGLRRGCTAAAQSTGSLRDSLDRFPAALLLKIFHSSGIGEAIKIGGIFQSGHAFILILESPFIFLRGRRRPYWKRDEGGEAGRGV